MPAGEAQPPPPPDTLSFQVVVVGGRASGKTAILEAMLQETAALGGAPEEDAGGMRICHVACEYRGQPFAPSLLELPSDARHAAALPYFCAAAACVVVSVNLADSGCVKDFEDRLGALGGPPSCGLVVANCAGGAPMGAPEWERLAALRDLADRMSLQVLHFESLQQLESGRLLQTACGLVLRDAPQRPDALHLLGRGVSRHATVA